MSLFAIKQTPSLIYLNDKSKKADYSPHVKTTFEQQDGGIIIQFMPPSECNIFSLNNQNVYNSDGECIKTATEKEYIDAFQIELAVSNKIKPIDVPDYLDFHYTQSSNKEKLLRIVKATSMMEILKQRPTKLFFIKEWIDKTEKQALEGKQPSTISINANHSNVQVIVDSNNSSQNISAPQAD